MKIPITRLRSTCRALSQIHGEEHSRSEVARGSIAAILFVAKLMMDDPTLVATASTAIYNFVSREGAQRCFRSRCIVLLYKV